MVMMASTHTQTCMQRSPFPTKIPLRNGYGKVGGTDRRPLTDKMWRSKEGNWNQSFWKNLSVPELTGKLRSLVS